MESFLELFVDLIPIPRSSPGRQVPIAPYPTRIISTAYTIELAYDPNGEVNLVKVLNIELWRVLSLVSSLDVCQLNAYYEYGATSGATVSGLCEDYCDVRPCDIAWVPDHNLGNPPFSEIAHPSNPHTHKESTLST